MISENFRRVLSSQPECDIMREAQHDYYHNEDLPNAVIKLVNSTWYE